MNKLYGFPSTSSGGSGGGLAPSTPIAKEKGKGKAAERSGGSTAKKRKIQQIEEEIDEQETVMDDESHIKGEDED